MFYSGLDQAADDKSKSVLLSELREWHSYPSDFILRDITQFYVQFITDCSGLIHDLNIFLILKCPV